MVQITGRKETVEKVVMVVNMELYGGGCVLRILLVDFARRVVTRGARLVIASLGQSRLSNISFIG